MTRTKPTAEFPFRATLQRLRKQKKWTQQQVADKLGISPVTVSGWEIGKRIPEPPMLPRIAQLFGTTVDNLLGYSKTAESFKAGDVVYVPMYGSVAIIEGRLAFWISMELIPFRPKPPRFPEAYRPFWSLFPIRPWRRRA